MKKGDSLHLRYAWWDSNRPGALAGPNTCDLLSG